ncbi:unannotated protein [freshwater metagenome]|uniref:Unannotated protein n=1 Tax=freshwater metagenome TaxID=449393 RepID=A0A6J6I3R3_9ZZZZ
MPVSTALEITVGRPMSEIIFRASVIPPDGAHFIIAISAKSEIDVKSLPTNLRIDSSTAIFIGTSLLRIAKSSKFSHGCSIYSKTLPKRRKYSCRYLRACVRVQPPLISRRILASGTSSITASRRSASLSKSFTFIFIVVHPG